MDKIHLKRTAALTVFSLLVTAVILTSATFAWFTASRSVSTSRVTSRTSESTVQLQISAYGGTFTPGAEADITPVNGDWAQTLLPVSTADLKTFLYCPVTQSGEARSFVPVEDESRLYHGRVSVRALVTDAAADARLAVYLDDTDTLVRLAAPDSEESLLLNAARLGLTLNGGEPMIFTLSGEENQARDQIRNTYLNETLLEDGLVLGYTGGAAAAVVDPALDPADYTMQRDAAISPQPLFTLLPGEIYTLDIYFYLEGCDPDCSEAIALDGADFQLALYGVLLQ